MERANNRTKKASAQTEKPTAFPTTNQFQAARRVGYLAWAIVTGILEITVAAWMHRVMGNEWMLLLNGIASVLFGVLLVLWPAAGLLALTWLIGIYAIVFGVLLLTRAFQWRKVVIV